MALSLALLLLTGLLLLWARPHHWRHAGWVAALPPAVVTAWQLSQMGSVAEGHILAESWEWVPLIGLEFAFRLDGLALLFGLIVTGMGAFVALYTGYYFEDDERQGQFYFLLFTFMVSMLGLVWSDNLLALFVFWEGTSITSYLLIAFNTTSRTAREGGRRALIVTGLGGLAMLGGLVLLGTAAGTYSISGIITSAAKFPLATNAVYGWALALILLGAFTKSAQFPFHFWLPGAMAAPTPASAYLHSATMVKAGVFLLARLTPALGGTPEWTYTVTTVGAITMVLGAVSALRYTDLKAILAYATVSQLGMLTMLLGLPVKYAPTAVALGILAHSLYKGPLFLVAGIVDHATGERDLRRLAGLARPLWLTTLTVLLASFSMTGIPFGFGFLAKEYALTAGEQAGDLWAKATGWSIMGSVALAGAFFMAIAATLLWDVFLRRRRQESAEVHHKPRFSFVLAALLPAALGIALPFLAEPLNHLLLAPAASAIAPERGQVEVALWHGVTTPLLFSLSALAAGLVLFALRRQLYGLLNRVPAWLSGMAAFGWANDAVYSLARTVTRFAMSGSLSAQVSVTIMLAALIALTAFFTSADWAAVAALPGQWNIPVYEVALAAMAIVAAVVATQARQRLSAIISLGVVGWTVTLYFILFSAPDLALTQLLVETLTVVLLVLVFFRIAPDRLPPLERRTRFWRWTVALAAGLFGFTMVLFVETVQYGESIAGYFTNFSVPEGEGANVVNVILVDFRGYDTLGEITVLVVAALGSLALWQAPRMATIRRRYLKAMRRAGANGAEASEEPVVSSESGAHG